MKRCTKCGDEKPLEAFYRCAKVKDGRQAECITCHGGRAPEWQNKNRSSLRAACVRYYHKDIERSRQNSIRRYRKRQEQARAHARAKYHEFIHALSPEQVRTFREMKRISHIAWRKANIDHYRALARMLAERRRARFLAASGRASVEQIQARVDYFGGRCWVCTKPYEEIDHVKPLSKGGSNWPANMRPICRRCNARKNDRWPFFREVA